MRIVDCDSHFIVPEIFDYVPIELRNNLPELIFDSDGQLIDVKYATDPIKNIADGTSNTMHCGLLGMSVISDRIKDLATMKVDLQLLAPQERAMRFNYSVEKNLGAAMSHSYNLTVKKIVEQYPDKFFGAALVPLQDIDLGLQELKWAIKNNFKIVYIDYTNYNYKINSNIAWSAVERMDEVYKICEENEITLYMHFSMHHKITFTIPEHITLIKNNNLMNRLEMSLYDLVTGDVFDRYPKLQIVVTEGAQKNMLKVLPVLKEAYAQNPSLFKGKKHYLDYFKENIFFTVDIEMTESFDLLFKNFGSERLLFSTDYPHIDPSGLNKWNDVDDLYKLELSQIDLEDIAFRNAEKLFKLV
jgi:predicted TIM-barrel fold metal-dependent hydrolase